MCSGAVSFLHWAHFFWSLVYISFANFRSKQIFDFLNETNWEWSCEMMRSRVRCDEIGDLLLFPSVESFWSLVYISFANFRSKQIFDFLNETNWERHCDAQATSQVQWDWHFENFATSSAFILLHSFWSLVYISGTLQTNDHCDVRGLSRSAPYGMGLRCISFSSLKVFKVLSDLLHEWRNDMTFYFAQDVRSQICLSWIARTAIAARKTAAAAPTAADASVAAPTAATASRAAAAAANEAASCSNWIPCAWLAAGPKQPGRARPSCNSQ